MVVLQLQNKQDWARLRGYEVHQMAELVDSHMRPGPWQKVGMIRKVCASSCFGPAIHVRCGGRKEAS